LTGATPSHYTEDQLNRGAGWGRGFILIATNRGLLTLMLGLGLLAGCAHVKPMDTVKSEPRTVSEILKQENLSAPAPKSPLVHTSGDIAIRGMKLKNTGFDIPISLNSRVYYWIDYFTGTGRRYFDKYLERSEYFIPYMAPLLKQNGLPQDLVYLAMIESGFNNLARSHAKAVGPWQFMSATGKRYGLSVNWWVDERRDIRKSTLAAVEYLRDLYNMFQSWELAAAAYNAGENKVAKAIQRYGTTDFWVISKQRYLKTETRDYVPKIIAAALIAKNREQFGFKASPTKPAADEAVAGDGELVKVEKRDKLTEQDRAERDSDAGEPDTASAPAEGNSDANSDVADASDAPGVDPIVALQPAPEIPLAKPVPTPHLSDNGEIQGEQLAEFDVQSPADLLKVARAAGLSYHTIKSLNPELTRWCTPPTSRTYRVKLPVSVKDKFLATYNHAAYPRQVQFATYKARRGETLARIARQFGIKVDPIADLNGLSPRVPLRKGAKVLLPMPSDRTRSLASLEVRDPPEKAKASTKRKKRHPKSYKVTYKKRESARHVLNPDT
jgi:membrane-bound lytic murein transglycosylase D